MDEEKTDKIERPAPKYFVKYKVRGFNGEHAAGPWPKGEAILQARDIEGYEGVYDLRLTPEGDESP